MNSAPGIWPHTMQRLAVGHAHSSQISTQLQACAEPRAQAAAVSEQVVPTLLVMLHNGDTESVPHLTALVAQLRAHLRRWLPDIIHLVTSLWPRPLTQGQQPSKLLLNLLALLGTLAGALSGCWHQGQAQHHQLLPLALQCNGWMQSA